MGKNKPKMNFNNLKEMLEETEKHYGDRTAYMFKTEKEGEFRKKTYKEFIKEIKELGTALVKMGLKGKRIAIISENRYEWELSYLSITTGAGIVVPLDKALPDNEIENLILRSEIEGIIYSKKYDNIMNELREKKNTNLKYFISMDLEENTNGIYSQKQLIEKGQKLLEQGNREYLDAKIENDKMAIMLFTSGTTAMSKAVMLSQTNIITNIKDIDEKFDMSCEDRLLSFLPLHHVFECTVGFLYIVAIGACICFSDGVKHIADNLKEYKITAMISVPAVYEVMYRKVMKTIEKKGKTDAVKKGIKISQALLKVGIDVRKKIFKEIHDNLGGEFKVAVAGGAALDVETQKGFNDLGIVLMQGYGLTETAPVVSAETVKERRIGAIGKKFPSIEVKLIDENEEGVGELAVKGPSVMIGYYENEEATKTAIDKDGWFHTGDLAKIDKDGYIYICGRRKNVIVLSNGKNVFPEELETLLNKVEGIKESFVYERKEPDGDIKICVKIVYDKELIKELYNIEGEENIKEFLWKKVKEVNNLMPKYKYIREMTITEQELIKTTTLKIKRHEEIKRI